MTSAKQGASLAPDQLTVADLSTIRQREVQKCLQEVEQRNARFFDEEVLKLDHWSDDLKQGLEREIKDFDKQIREARKVSALAGSLSDKLAAQKDLRALESTRSRKRRELYDAQDRIDEQRDELIAKIEKQLRQRQRSQSLFVIRWTLS